MQKGTIFENETPMIRYAFYSSFNLKMEKMKKGNKGRESEREIEKFNNKLLN